MTGSMLWGQGPGLIFVVPRLAQSLAERTLGICGMNKVGAQVTSQSHQDITGACLSYRKPRTKKRAEKVFLWPKQKHKTQHERK